MNNDENIYGLNLIDPEPIKPVNKKKTSNKSHSILYYILFTITLLLIPDFPNNGRTINLKIDKILEQIKYERIAKENIFKLKDRIFTQNDYLEIKGCFSYVIRPIVKKHKITFNLSEEDLIDCIFTIAMSESSNSKGLPFSSPLWINDNNPYGIKAFSNKKTSYVCFEEVKHKMIKTKDYFARFSSLQEATEYFFTICESNQFKKLKNCKSSIEFINILTICGYYTSTTWSKIYLIPLLKKLKTNDQTTKNQ